MIQIEIEKLEDVRQAVIEIYKNCPHQFNNNDIIDEMKKGIVDILNTIYIINKRNKNKI